MKLRTLSVVTLVACSATPEPSGPLELTRDDGTVIAFAGEARAVCAPIAGDAGSQPAIQIEQSSDLASWSVRAVLADVAIGRAVQLPTPGWRDESASGVSVHVGDYPYEASSGHASSEGSLRFTEIDCDGFVEIVLDATLASVAVDGTPGAPIHARGVVRVPVAPAPAP